MCSCELLCSTLNIVKRYPCLSGFFSLEIFQPMVAPRDHSQHQQHQICRYFGEPQHARASVHRLFARLRRKLVCSRDIIISLNQLPQRRVGCVLGFARIKRASSVLLVVGMATRQRRLRRAMITARRLCSGGGWPELLAVAAAMVVVMMLLVCYMSDI